MKRILTICAVVIGFITFTAMQTTSQAEFKFESETHDFGKIPQGKPVSVDFKFVNVGAEPLIISNVETTCGCTTKEYTKTPIKKGESGLVTVTYNASAVSPFTKGITIKSNAKTPVKVLYIKGEVVGSSSK